MPGFTGFLGRCPGVDAATCIQRMVSTMVHEPFYNHGTLLVDQLGLAVGWTAIKGSYADCMPAWNEDRSVCLIFAGEHFAEPADYDRLRSAGHRFARNDASSLVHLYEETGEQFFATLNGTFSGLLVDLRRREVVLFNDRFGLSRVYVHESPHGFYFSSEAKSLLKVLPSLRQFDEQGLGEYFSCGTPLQNRSLFAGVSLLPCGSAWRLHPGLPPAKQVYFQPSEWEHPEPISVETYYERLRDTLRDGVRRSFGGDQEVCLSLTGGLDSRMVIAAAPQKPGGLRCYSNRGMYRECVDAKLGRRVAAACGYSHQTITVDREFFRRFPELARKTVYFSDGAMDVIGAPGLYANQQARNIAPVRMTGNYGGEVLRAVTAFKAGSQGDWLLSDGFRPHYHRAAETFRAEKAASSLTSFILFKQVPWHHYARFAMESSQLTVRSPFLDNALTRLCYQAPADLETNQDLAHRLIHDLRPELRGLPTDRGRATRPAWMPARAWYWRREFLPLAEYTYDYGMPDWMAKVDRILGPLQLDRLFLGEQKYYHFRRWYRRELAPFVKEILLDPQTLSRPYLNGRALAEKVNAHVSGNGNATLIIHRILSTELIERELLRAG